MYDNVSGQKVQLVALLFYLNSERLGKNELGMLIVSVRGKN